MNLVHRRICRSGFWRKFVEKTIVPWTLRGVELGANVLEIGPGPGITTDAIRPLAHDLTCVEIDPADAFSLSRRVGGGSLRVLCGDATALPLPDGCFDAVVCFTMLHHVPSVALQDTMLREVARVLKPGGIFAGMDSLSSLAFRLIHLFDTMVVVDPRGFPKRLSAAGFENVGVDLGPHSFRFTAHKPS